MGIYVVLSSVLGLLLLCARSWWAPRARGDLPAVRQEDPDRGLTRRSFVGGVALGAAVVSLGRLRLPGPASASPPASPTSLVSAARAVPLPIRSRMILPMNSGTNVLPNMSVTICARPQVCGVRPDRMILAHAEDWWIEDILVGGVSQIGPGSGGVPGAAFGADALDTRLVLPPVGTGIDFSIQARYVGSSPEGATFACGVLCDAIDDSPHVVGHPGQVRTRFPEVVC